MRTYDPIVGYSINDACAELALAAKHHGEPLEMTFNEIRVVADPGDDAATLATRWRFESDLRWKNYRASAEGTAEAQRRREEIARKQAMVDDLVATWPIVAPNGWAAILHWVETLTENADDVGVKLDHAVLASMLETSGHIENQHVGESRAFFETPDNLARYIMGQVINCLRSGMPPHPVCLGFIERWRRMTA